MRPRTGTAGTWPGAPAARAYRSSDDVGPGAAHDLLALLVLGHRFEHVELPPVLLAEVLEGGRRGDQVARAHGLAPHELLTAVDHAHEVDGDLRVEDRRPDRAGRVDDREHRRRDDVAKAGALGRAAVEVDLVGLAYGVCVFADLFAPDFVLVRWEGLSDGRHAARHSTSCRWWRRRRGRARRGTPPAAPRCGRPASSASCLPSASRAACAYA